MKRQNQLWSFVLAVMLAVAVCVPCITFAAEKPSPTGGHIFIQAPAKVTQGVSGDIILSFGEVREAASKTAAEWIVSWDAAIAPVMQAGEIQTVLSSGTAVLKQKSQPDGSIYFLLSAPDGLKDLKITMHVTGVSMADAAAFSVSQMQVADANGAIAVMLDEKALIAVENQDSGSRNPALTPPSNNGTSPQSPAAKPKKTEIKGKVIAKSRSFTVKWKKVKSVSGYQVQYSTNRKFTKKTTKLKTVNKASVTKLTVKKLKADKKYYIRVRTCKKVKGKVYCSGWSKVKNVRTKK